MESLNRIAVRILEKFPPLFAHAVLRKKSPLREWGWFRSLRTGTSADAEAEPIPWISYAATAFLDRRVPASARVFEYGAGNGTLWWADRAASVVAVEHDPEWHDAMQERAPSNVTLHFADQGSAAYIEAARRSGDPYDIIVIDGRDRVACAREAVKALAPSGVIIWDDTERPRYAEGIAFLHEQGFRRIEFRGFAPVEFMMHETSIFYRDGNCLGI